MEYYHGRGADPLVKYIHELDHPLTTIRQYEWRGGIVRCIQSLVELKPQTRWLDFGCGNGGLVRHGLQHKVCDMIGYDQGAVVDLARQRGVAILHEEDLDALDGTCDVVTAIEVLEHLTDPMIVLRRIRRLLKPGGVFFYTTGNARPFRGKILSWNYVLPEIHVSFFEPETLSVALREAGFRPDFRGYMPGHTNIIRFKVLKCLHQINMSLPEKILPWSALSRLIDSRVGVSRQPVGWAV